jgi:hypothetical protein
LLTLIFDGGGYNNGGDDGRGGGDFNGGGGDFNGGGGER